MKKTQIFLFLLLCSSLAYAQLPIAGKWSYSFMDAEEHALLNFNDFDWKTKESTALKWVDKEIPKNSNIVWIRKKIVIPSSLKKDLEKTGALMLYLGRIKQEDRFYFNGKLAGETKSGDIRRAYVLRTDDILWDQENIIAIRISHWGGTSVEFPPSIIAAKPENILVLGTSAEGVSTKDQVKDKKATYNLSIKNNSNKTINADLISDFYDLNQKKLASFVKQVTLKPGDNTFPTAYTSPSSFLKIQYHIIVPEFDYELVWNDEYGFENIDYKAANPIIPYKVKEVFAPAKLGQQTISGWLGERIKANQEQRLHKVDETSLLAGFINKPGVHPWIGEHAGKFLEAACNAYEYSEDPALKLKIDRVAQQLIAAQLSDGYLGTYDKESRWTSWDVWSHKYDLVGLLSYYQLTGYKPALIASEKIGDLLSSKFGDQPGQLDIIKSGTHVGMAATSVIDPMTDLYRFSGKKEYLDFCYYITRSYDSKNGPKIIKTLNSVGRVDKTANDKAYELMSNLVGLAKFYRLTADEQFLKPVLTAWKDIKDKRLYITGTTSSFEHFQDDYLLPASEKDNMGEGCVTTTWLQLNFQLLSIFGETNYVDELERTIYNHLTGAENPQTGCVSYYTPLMGVKPYNCSITCCMSSIPRGIAMIPLFSNGKIKGSPAFYFYQPGSYRTTIHNKTAVEFITKTKFLENGKVTILVNPAVKSTFEILLRKPYWATDFKIIVNGSLQNVANDELITVNREWAKGDLIDISFDLPVKILDGGASYPGFIAFQRGPQVLAFDQNLNRGVKTDFSVEVKKPGLIPLTRVAFPENWIGNQAYQIEADVDGEAQKVILVPYADASQTGGEVSTWLKSRQ